MEKTKSSLVVKRRFLITGKKGYSYRLLDVDNEKTYRLLVKSYPKLTIGTLVCANHVKTVSDLIDEMNIMELTQGDSEKSRVEVKLNDYQLGDLLDGVPIVSFGRPFSKQGETYSYAYFRPQFNR